MIAIGMSTACAYPHGSEQAFALASRLGFDGIEVMVTRDRRTQDADILTTLAQRYGMPVLSIHAPVLALTQFVWGLDPVVKLERSAGLAKAVGAPTVVVHPPFRWQRRYAADFTVVVREISDASGVDLDGSPGAAMFALGSDGVADVELVLTSPRGIAAAAPGGGPLDNGNLANLAALRTSADYEGKVTQLVTDSAAALAAKVAAYAV